MATQKTSKKATLTRKQAIVAARKAQKHYKGRAAKKSSTWQKGGKQWLRVLGHFGAV